MEDSQPIDSIETHMLQHRTHRSGIDFKIVSERYYSKINRFVVIYEPIELTDGIVGKIRAQTIEKGFDRITTESFLITYMQHIQKINERYPKEVFPNLAAELEKHKKHEVIEELWRKCNFKEHPKWTGDMDEVSIFYSEDANGIPLIPLSQTIHEKQIAVVYYPLMDSETVVSRLIREEGYMENREFDLL